MRRGLSYRLGLASALLLVIFALATLRTLWRGDAEMAASDRAFDQGESALALGARVNLCLALPEAEFVERSVESPGTNWVARFEAVRDRSVVRVLQRDRGAASENVFEATNRWMLEIAAEMAPRVRVLAVWDEQLGDGHGGTASFVESASAMGAEVVIIPLEPSTG